MRSDEWRKRPSAHPQLPTRPQSARSTNPQATATERFVANDRICREDGRPASSLGHLGASTSSELPEVALAVCDFVGVESASNRRLCDMAVMVGSVCGAIGAARHAVITQPLPGDCGM